MTLDPMPYPNCLSIFCSLSRMLSSSFVDRSFRVRESANDGLGLCAWNLARIILSSFLLECSSLADKLSSKISFWFSTSILTCSPFAASSFASLLTLSNSDSSSAFFFSSNFLANTSSFSSNFLTYNQNKWNLVLSINAASLIINSIKFREVHRYTYIHIRICIHTHIP